MISAVDVMRRPLFKVVFAGMFSSCFTQGVRSILTVEFGPIVLVIGIKEGSAGIEITTLAAEAKVVIKHMVQQTRIPCQFVQKLNEVKIKQ